MQNYYTLTSETYCIYNYEWGTKSLKQKLGDEVCIHKWKLKFVTLLDQLLGLEEAPQIEHLPGGQSQETTHAENAEVQHAAVRWLYNRIKTTNSIIYITWQKVVIYHLFSNWIHSDMSYRTGMMHQSDIAWSTSVEILRNPFSCSGNKTSINIKNRRSIYIYIYIYGAPILDVSRSHTTTHHSR